MSRRQQMQQQQQAPDQLYDPMQGGLKERTHLLQLYCSDPQEAPRMISETSEGAGIPLMVICDTPACFHLKLNVPSGMLILSQSWGAHNGILEPGCYCCYCSYKTIPVMITRNTIRFKCPIQQVPTKDDVRVSLDIGVNFHIGQNESTFESDAKKFFYNFGPNRLEELLQEEIDEGIRNFVRGVKVVKIRDMKTEMTTNLTHELCEKFKPYGVIIDQVNIMNIIIPRDLRIALMATTNFDVYLQKQVRHQYYKLLLLKNEENKTINQLRKNLKQTLVSLQHDKDVEEINLLTEKIQQETNKIRLEIDAHMKQQTKVIDANNIKFLSERRAKTEAAKALAKATAYMHESKQQADTDAAKIKLNAQTRLVVAQSRTQALIKESAAESAQSNNMEGSRRHEEKLHMSKALNDVARKGHMVISNKNGQGVLDYYNNSLDIVSKR